MPPWIIDRFPTDPDVFTSTLASRLLPRISAFLLFLPFSFSTETNRSLTDHHRSVEYAPCVLQTLKSMSLPLQSLGVPVEDVLDQGEEDEPPHTLLLKVKPKTQRKNKQGRRKGPLIDTKHFQTLGHVIPTSKEDSDQLARRMLDSLKSALQVSNFVGFYELLLMPVLSFT